MYAFNTSLAANVPSFYNGDLSKMSNLSFERPIVSDNSQASGEIQKTLLTKLQNIKTITSDIDKDHPTPEKSKIVLDSHLASQSSPQLKYIDDTDSGNLTTAFIDTISAYKTFLGDAYNTLEFFTDEKDKDNNIQQWYSKTRTARSIFNPYYGVKSRGHHTNLPLFDNISRCSNDDISDCSIWKLLQLSAETNHVGNLGQEYYRLADFMFCKDLGKVSNNHLITLRRYATPVGDNIFGSANLDDEGFGNAPDIGHLVTWFGTDDNKLSDIIKMSFHASWKEMKSEIQDVQSKEDSADRGVFGMINNTFNTNYNKMQAAGQAGTNNIVSWLGTKISSSPLNFTKLDFGKAGQNGQSGDNSDVLRNYDQHKIYEPKNTIRSNHYYEGNLEFSHEFTLNFSYELRGYGNINSKSAMLDLIANITRVTYTKGKFWGGDVKWIGPPQNNSGYTKMNAFVDKEWNKLEGFTADVASGGINWKELLSSFSDSIGNMINNVANKIESGEAGDIIANKANECTKSIASFLQGHGKPIMGAMNGQLKNALGRPALYAINSFVKGDNLGLWHVTIGNPRNPIMCIGNLILTNAEISVGDCPLGLDDFPTELKVSVTLKHCKPRDMVDIQKMFTKGEAGIYVGLGQSGFTKFYKGKKGNWSSKEKYKEAGYHQLFGSDIVYGKGKSRIGLNFSEIS